jgi:hypothetical protein
MHNRYFVASLTIAGEKAQAFSGISLNLPDYTTDATERIIENSRRRFGARREVVDRYVQERYLLTGNNPKTIDRTQASGPKPAQLSKKDAVPAAAKITKRELSSSLARVALGQTIEKPKRRRRRRKKQSL